MGLQAVIGVVLDSVVEMDAALKGKVYEKKAAEDE